MTDVDKFLKAVMACLGTPFCHQGRLPHVGLDCIGLVVVGLKAVQRQVQDRFDYGVRPDGRSLANALCVHGAKEVSDIKAGDVLLIRYDNQPQHDARPTKKADALLIHSFQV